MCKRRASRRGKLKNWRRLIRGDGVSGPMRHLRRPLCAVLRAPRAQLASWPPRCAFSPLGRSRLLARYLLACGELMDECCLSRMEVGCQQLAAPMPWLGQHLPLTHSPLPLTRGLCIDTASPAWRQCSASLAGRLPLPALHAWRRWLLRCSMSTPPRCSTAIWSSLLTPRSTSTSEGCRQSWK